jgi:formyltetrahydrofolate deformylase
MSEAILLVSCPDKTGHVFRLASFISENNGNILDLDEHVDPVESHFYARIQFDIRSFDIPKEALHQAISPLMQSMDAKWAIHFTSEKMRAVIFVSKTDHCLQEILWRYRLNEFSLEIAAIISNHPDLEPLATSYGIPYHHLAITKENKVQQEINQVELIQKYEANAVVLARYMQILSPSFIAHFPNQIINIHHSFLPAFAGGSPYHQAFERGVKIIGATSHFVTEEVDEGPIIEQDITRITHKDAVTDLKRKGRDLERLVLARAIKLYTEHRILVRGNKTVIFD